MNKMLTAVAAMATFMASSCNITQHMGANGVPDIKPPTAKQLEKAFTLLHEPGKVILMQESKDGSFNSRGVQLNKEYGVFLHHDNIENKNYAVGYNPAVIELRAAQRYGFLELGNKEMLSEQNHSVLQASVIEAKRNAEILRRSKMNYYNAGRPTP